MCDRVLTSCIVVPYLCIIKSGNAKKQAAKKIRRPQKKNHAKVLTSKVSYRIFASSNNNNPHT